MMWQPDVVIYHGNCDDGYAGAWSCWRRWGDDVEYVPMGYGDPLPDIAGKRVLMVDYSLKCTATMEAAEKAAGIVVLDHHATAQKELDCFRHPVIFSLEEAADYLSVAEGRDRVVVYFDMEKSGCRLAWEFCHPGEAMPRLLEHIEDRDLWRFKLPETKAISAGLRAYDPEFALFDVWTSAEMALSLLEGQGRAILRAHEKTVSDLLKNAYMAEVAGHTVPVLNVPYQYASDCGHELLKRYPEAPFAATWVRTGDGKIAWSLRSDAARLDVGEVAKSMGGGGHRNAAGFSVKAEAAVHG